MRELPAAIEKVGVFVKSDRQTRSVRSADEAGLTAVQLHGDNEDPHLADVIVERRPHLKVLVGSFDEWSKSGTLRDDCGMPTSVHAFLLDTGNATKYGGTGQEF